MTGEGVAANVIRKVLNVSLQETTPALLIDAIRKNLSIMGNAGEHVRYYAGHIPPFAMRMAERQLARVNKDHPGGIVGLVMEWLMEDQPIYHSLLLNTDGGKEWLKTQVEEILAAFGIRIAG